MTSIDQKSRIAERTIDIGASILEAMQRMDRTDRKLLLVFTGDQFAGLLSIGDIQRAIIANKLLQSPIKDIIRKEIRVGRTTDSFDGIKEVMIRFRTECMPVLDEEGRLEKVIFWEDIFPEEPSHPPCMLDLPVVIMAGGKGTRMRPLTHVLPKPLLPLDNRTILEHIMASFSTIGCRHFFLSVNYKADLIRFYVSQLDLPDYRIDYIQEEEPLGTAGSLHLLKGKITSRFFVTNCDILIDQDYSEIVRFHEENRNELTIVSAFKHVAIPYGTVETGEQGTLVSLKEKPELTFKVNTGFYMLEPSLLNEIPANTMMNITDLIQKILDRKGNVGVFPVSEHSWKDVGEWKEYLRFTNGTGQ